MENKYEFVVCHEFKGEKYVHIRDYNKLYSKLVDAHKQPEQKCDPTKWPIGTLVIAWDSTKPFSNDSYITVFKLHHEIQNDDNSFYVDGWYFKHVARADGEFQYRLWTPYSEWKDHREEV